jgi:moderate conductance mechanosensitive channel
LAQSKQTLVGRCYAVLFLNLVLLLTAPALAEPAPATPSADELQQLVDTLQDDKARNQFLHQLQTMIEARRATAAPQTTASPAGWLSQRVDQLSSEVLAGTSAVVDAPRVIAWGRTQIEDEAARRGWLQIGLAFVIVFGCAALAEWMARRFLARLLPRAPTRGGTRGSRLLFAILDLVIDAFPVVAFAAVAYIVLPITLPPSSVSRTSLALLVHATVITRLILAVAKSLLLASDVGFGISLTEETRNYLYIWIKRFTCLSVFGFAFAEGAWWLGIPGGIYALMLKAVALVLAILAILFVLQNRGAVSEWVAGPPELAAPAHPASWSRMRRRFAETWHILAVVYILGIFAVYALHIAGGFGYVLRATVLSLVAIIGAQLLVRFGDRAAARGFAIAPDLKMRFPTLEQRANRYLPILTGLIRVVVYLTAALLVLEAWDIGSLAWFETDLGRQATGTGLSIAAVIGIALAVWEVFAAAIERHLATLAPSSRTRQRTLLPLLRTTMLCVIVVMAGLIVLSQVGINIAPLLAGAGVIGLAIGFGSQALVKDIITGLFILIEDQIAVGDIVDVGKDHRGTVEAISVRTIRLRDQAGVVHTVPFSEVTSIKNLTKDFAYAVARIAISYGEDIDRVVEILRATAEELMADEEVAPFVLDSFNYQGVDSLDDNAVVLLVRIRTTPGKHLVVGRAFNRLVKIAFEKHGIMGRDPAPVIVTTPRVDQPDVTSGGRQAAAAPSVAMKPMRAAQRAPQRRSRRSTSAQPAGSDG